ncbi:siderophore-interacting protein [Actinocorallia sp. A-T 12471]|uniref:siderophore-interacting protein n=1 Tax=Actinocorallia sp. A-T 12471 TaxID=3089813 RepID=UPI0029CB8F83|nr:siderophore-interacting protein [Actinocorallia sp. A-T 12471]MDX6742335.1 siderophore-interacting protein [Actinocorallia sp. A-T 12471]
MDRSDPRERVAAHHRAGDGVARIGYPIGVRRVPVVRRARITPRILRLTLAGPGLAGLHTYQADDHVKIVFPDADGTRRDPVPNDHAELDWPRPFTPARKYTIRRYDPEALELDLDFVLHEGGVAATWAEGAALGEEVTVAGPPGAKAFPHTYDHYVFAVDATGLPSVARWLDEAPEDVSAHVVVETGDESDHAYPLASRAGVDVTWLVRDGESRLAATVAALPAPEGRAFLFAAGEADDLKPLRAWSRNRLDALITGYWKRGVAGLED